VETQTIKTQIQLPKVLYDLLMRRASEMDSSLSELVKRAIDKYLDPTQPTNIFTEDDPLWEIVGSAESEIIDGSVNHDHYIYSTPKRK